jgi:hypothetical protein
MDKNIKRIAALFPQIRDIPADPSLLEKAAATARAESLSASQTPKHEAPAAVEPLKDPPHGKGKKQKPLMKTPNRCRPCPTTSWTRKWTMVSPSSQVRAA